MAKAIKICDGATIAAGDVERIHAALEELAKEKDPHAARSVSVTVTLNVHRDFPKLLYKGKESKSVANEEEAAAAKENGFGEYDHEVFNAKEE